MTSPVPDLEQVGRDGRQLVWRLTAALSVAILAIGVLGLSLLAVDKANRTSKQVQGSCQFYRDLSQLPLSPTSTRVLFTIIADARVAYEIGDCERVKGKLPAADPRVTALLPKGLR